MNVPPSSKCRQTFNKQQEVRIPKDLILQHRCCENTIPLTYICPDILYVTKCNACACIRSVTFAEGLVHMKQDVLHKLKLRPVFLFLQEETAFRVQHNVCQGTFVSPIQHMPVGRSVGKTTTININTNYVPICHLLVKATYNLFKSC